MKFSVKKGDKGRLLYFFGFLSFRVNFRNKGLEISFQMEKYSSSI